MPAGSRDGRRLTFPLAAVDFLIRNGFDFDLPYTQGVPYLSRKDEHDIRAAWLARDLEKATLSDMPIKEADAVLIDHIRSSVKQWQEEPASTRESHLNIPNTSEGGEHYASASQILNRYQIRLVHQIVRNEYPKLKTTGKGHFIQITPFDDKRDLNERLQQARYRDRDISRAVEFRWLIEAISGGDITKMPLEYFTNAFSTDVKPPDGEDRALKTFIDGLQQRLSSRRRILIGHNCFTDLVYLYSCFVGQLPEKVEEFQDAIRELFPAVVDTKFIASFGTGWHSTSLQDVELELNTDGTGVPLIETPVDFDRYTVGQKLHEAGFDSLLTAKIAIKLSAKLEKQGKFPAYHVEEDPVTTDDDVSEDYITAPESIADSESINLAATAHNVLSTPVTAIGNFFRNDLASTGQQFDNATRLGNHASTSGQLEDLMMFSNKREDGDEDEDLEASEDGGPTTGPLEDASTSAVDPASLSRLPESTLISEDKPLTKAEILEKVGRGELMPRWEGSRGFWQSFGKKLQVNSAEEGICHL